MSATATQMVKEELKADEITLVKELKNLQKCLSNGNLTEFQKKVEEIKKSFQEEMLKDLNEVARTKSWTSLMSQINNLKRFFLENQNEKNVDEIIKKLVPDIESTYRKKEILENKNVWQNLAYFSYKGTLEDIDFFRQVKIEFRLVTQDLERIDRTQDAIYKRECRALLETFGLEPVQLREAVEAMIRNERTGSFAPLPEIFAPGNITKAIKQLEETKKLIDRALEDNEIEDWLLTKNKNFLNKTPKDLILMGKGFRILQYFIRLGEGIP